MSTHISAGHASSGAVILMLAACSTGGQTTQPADPLAGIVATPVTMTAADLAGNWGLASYRDEADRARTTAEARSACSNPYKVGPGQNGGVMMHLADQAQPSEVFLKTDAAGRTFIGPAGAAGVPQDRVVTSYQDNVLVTQWLDAGTRDRYGTMVFVRCAAA